MSEYKAERIKLKSNIIGYYAEDKIYCPECAVDKFGQQACGYCPDCGDYSRPGYFNGFDCLECGHDYGDWESFKCLKAMCEIYELCSDVRCCECKELI